MHKYRVGLIVSGLLLLGFGAFRLLTEVPLGDVVSLGIWMVVAVLVHDGLIAPLTVGTGVLLTRIPPRTRRYVQGALVVGAFITVIAVPLIARRDTQPEIKAILLRDYAGNLALLLGLIAAVAVAAYLARVARDHTR